MKPAILLLLAVTCLASEPGVVRVQLGERDGGKIVDLPLEDYVAAVLAGESSVFRSQEGLKAMSVAIRTFAVRLKGRHAKEGFDLCGNTHCQLVDLRSVQQRFTAIAEATRGELLWYAGKPVFTCYSRDCGGRTEDVDTVWPGAGSACTRGVRDPECAHGGSWQWAVTGDRLATALRRSGLRTPATIERVSVLKRTAGGRAATVSLVGRGSSVPISAGALRFAVGRELGWNTLRSDLWQVRGEGGEIVFTGSGAGHGAGLCQRGADQMGVEGRTYREILAHYFPGAVVGINARGLAWTRLGGERTAVLTTSASRDGGVVAIADRIAGELNLSPGVEIRIYPDVETFRNATAEPGWVAAHASGRRIHLQPLPPSLMARTLRHELLHVMIEDKARKPLPVWFREGLVAHLERSRDPSAASGAPADLDIRQTADAAKARRAYADARARVDALVARHGEATVMSWLATGLPPGL